MSDPPQLRLNDECLDSRHVGSVQHFSVGYPAFPRDTHDLAQASEASEASEEEKQRRYMAMDEKVKEATSKKMHTRRPVEIVLRGIRRCTKA